MKASLLGPRARHRISLAVRVLGTAAALAWVASRVDPAAVRNAAARIPLASLALAVALVFANVVAGALRWRVVLRAYGATRIARFTALVRLYLVAMFYNTYLPGAVAGDVGRAVVTRDAFADEGTTGALAVVLIERALGLLGLFALLAVGLVATPGGGQRGALWWWTVLGGAGSAALVAAVALARRLASWLPGRIGSLAGKLPVLRDYRRFAAAVGLSVATQGLVAVAGWVLLAALAPISLAGSLLVVPLAAATAFLPITVGGAGAREAVYVALCGSLFGMAEADALTASLGLWLSHLVVGAIGGAAQLRRNRSLT
jgi:hypothetical protein